MKIGIQGELGAYSHIAVENLYKDADIKTCSTFEDTFKLAFEDPTIKIKTRNNIYLLVIFVLFHMKIFTKNCNFYNFTFSIIFLLNKL